MTPAEFKEARKSLGLTQQQLADVLGWSRGHVNRIESGSEPISRIAAVAVGGLINGYKPEDWPGKDE